MGVSYSIANCKNEIDYSKGYAILEYELENFLYDNRDKFDFDISLLSEINPFGDTILDHNDVKKLYYICEKLKYNDYFKDYKGSRDTDYLSGNEEAYDFLVTLEKLCKEAIEYNKMIYAKGD